ncbi:hypothetical protein [Streptomyces rhizoryzae]|uniref:hypothetical protein n=1 Tax=Streptomyces rhizoryzae TaxID=2932493 RepID=UPI003558594C
MPGDQAGAAVDGPFEEREPGAPSARWIRYWAIRSPLVGRPEDFARDVLRTVAADGPLRVRITLGPGSVDFSAAAVRAAEVELAAIGALVEEPPQAPA